MTQMANQTTTLSSAEVMELTGISPRQLHWWCLRGLIPGQPVIGSGYRRRWDAAQIERVKWLKAVSKLGVNAGGHQGLEHALSRLEVLCTDCRARLVGGSDA